MKTETVPAGALLEIVDMLNSAAAMSHAVFMASTGDGVTREAGNALATAVDDVGNRIKAARDRLEELRGASE